MCLNQIVNFAYVINNYKQTKFQIFSAFIVDFTSWLLCLLGVPFRLLLSRIPLSLQEAAIILSIIKNRSKILIRLFCPLG